MDQQQARLALLKIALVSLAVMSWVFTSFVFSTKPDFDSTSMSSSVQVDPLVSLVRLPASIPADLPAQLPGVFSSAPAFDPIRMEIVKLGCWDLSEVAEIPVSARWVRFTGRPCQSDAEPEAIRIRNLSNGYEGTIFTSHKDQLTTDFIPLQEGGNDLAIAISHADGVVLENRLTVMKRSAR